MKLFYLSLTNQSISHLHLFALTSDYHTLVPHAFSLFQYLKQLIYLSSVFETLAHQLFVHHDLSCAIKAHWIWDHCSDRIATVGKEFRRTCTEWCILKEGWAQKVQHSLTACCKMHSAALIHISLYFHINFIHFVLISHPSLPWTPAPPHSSGILCSLTSAFSHLHLLYFNSSLFSLLGNTTQKQWSGSLSELLLVCQRVLTHPAPRESSNFWASPVVSPCTG